MSTIRATMRRNATVRAVGKLSSFGGELSGSSESILLRREGAWTRTWVWLGVTFTST